MCRRTVQRAVCAARAGLCLRARFGFTLASSALPSVSGSTASLDPFSVYSSAATCVPVGDMVGDEMPVATRVSRRTSHAVLHELIAAENNCMLPSRSLAQMMRVPSGVKVGTDEMPRALLTTLRTLPVLSSSTISWRPPRITRTATTCDPSGLQRRSVNAVSMEPAANVVTVVSRFASRCTRTSSV